jgi:hypothetical protein
MHFALIGSGKIGRPAIWTAGYMFLLLLLFLLGVLENQVDAEGMGFLPLLVLTTPWSWLLMSVWDFPIWGTWLQGSPIAIFVTCNIISGTANGYFLYHLLRWRQKRAGNLRGQTKN